MILGFILICTPIFLYQYSITGQPFYNVEVERYHIYAITHIKENYVPLHEYELKRNDYESYVKYMFGIFPKTSFSERHDEGFDPMLNIYFYLFIIGLFSLRLFDKKIIFFLLWIVPFVILFEFSTLFQKVQRYLIIVMYPIIMYIGYYLSTLNIWKRLCLILIVILISLFQLGTATILDYEKWKIAGENEERAAQILAGSPEKDIYVSTYYDIPLLQFYFKYKKSYDGPYGYRDKTTTHFVDLHTSKATNGYVYLIFNHLEPIDEFQFYKESLPELPINEWHGIYGFKGDNNEVIGGIWIVE